MSREFWLGNGFFFVFRVPSDKLVLDHCVEQIIQVVVHTVVSGDVILDDACNGVWLFGKEGWLFDATLQEQLWRGLPVSVEDSINADGNRLMDERECRIFPDGQQFFPTVTDVREG